MSDFVTVARLDEVPEDALKGVRVDGRKIVLANRAGRIGRNHETRKARSWRWKP